MGLVAKKISVIDLGASRPSFRLLARLDSDSVLLCASMLYVEPGCVNNAGKIFVRAALSRQPIAVSYRREVLELAAQY